MLDLKKTDVVETCIGNAGLGRGKVVRAGTLGTLEHDLPFSISQ